VGGVDEPEPPVWRLMKRFDDLIERSVRRKRRYSEMDDGQWKFASARRDLSVRQDQFESLASSDITHHDGRLVIEEDTPQDLTRAG